MPANSSFGLGVDLVISNLIQVYNAVIEKEHLKMFFQDRSWYSEFLSNHVLKQNCQITTLFHYCNIHILSSKFH